MTINPRRLVLLRHAHAEPNGATDHGRPLTPAGPGEAEAVAHWLGGLGLEIEHALLSDARRTQQTARAVLDVMDPNGFALWDASGALYEAGPEAMLGVIQSVPADTHTLLVVGHNPAIAHLAQLLDDGTGSAQARTLLTQGFPPASAVVFEVPGEWLRLELFGARLLAARLGKGPT